jgi:hypothetical protein
MPRLSSGDSSLMPGPNCTRMLKGVVLPARTCSSKCDVRLPVLQTDHCSSYSLSMRQGFSPWLQNEVPQCNRSQTPGPLASGCEHDIWLIDSWVILWYCLNSKHYILFSEMGRWSSKALDGHSCHLFQCSDIERLRTDVNLTNFQIGYLLNTNLEYYC